MAKFNKRRFKRKNRKQKFTKSEKAAYYTGFGIGLQYPSGKAASYAKSLSGREEISFKNGLSKSRNIPVFDMNYFQKKKSR